MSPTQSGLPRAECPFSPMRVAMKYAFTPTATYDEKCIELKAMAEERNAEYSRAERMTAERDGLQTQINQLYTYSNELLTRNDNHIYEISKIEAERDELQTRLNSLFVYLNEQSVKHTNEVGSVARMEAERDNALGELAAVRTLINEQKKLNEHLQSYVGDFEKLLEAEAAVKVLSRLLSEASG